MIKDDVEESIAEMEKLKEEYIRNRSVFIKGESMIELLKNLGATQDDLEKLKLVSDDLPADPTLPFRKSKNGRFSFDFESGRIDRLEFQPFSLSANEDFVRHDSGQLRKFEEIDNDLQLNSAFQALLIFKAFMVENIKIAHRPNLDYDSKRWVCTVFNLRTITTPSLVGEPALEGVHSDGVDHTMTTLLSSENMTDDSAITSIHDMQEINGTRWNEINTKLVVGRHQHRHFLDTMLVVDHERKHSVSPVIAVNPQQKSTRDTLILFTRKPAVEGHISAPYDSFKKHVIRPMSVGIPSLLRP